jgi:hypothetical protein
MNKINQIIATKPIPEPYKIKVSRCLESIMEKRDDSDNNGSGESSGKDEEKQ